MSESEIPRAELYRSTDGTFSLEVRADGDAVWLNRQQLAELFGRDVKTIGRHVANARREELAAITLMVAMSDPKEKRLMVALVSRMLDEGAVQGAGLGWGRDGEASPLTAKTETR